jgi:Domain of unknown function (DUF4157)
MADSAAFEPVRRSSDRIHVAARTNEASADAQAGRPRSAGGLRRPSQLPVSGATTWLGGFPSPAGERAHLLKPLRPSAASMGAAPVRARPSPVPVRPVPGLLQGSGKPLDARVKEGMEARLGADFSGVRVHTDDAARASASDAGARAYTCGGHVETGGGYADKQTFGPELALAGRPPQMQAKLAIGEPGDKYEQEADQVAAEVVRRMNAPVVPGSPQAVQRQMSQDRDTLRRRGLKEKARCG